MLNKVDEKLLRENFEFVRDDQVDKLLDKRNKLDYGKILGRKYYDKLFKEHVVVDFRESSKGRIGVRWLSKQEVLHGKCEIVCSNTTCDEQRALDEYEFEFKYAERDVTKRVMLKTNLCRACALLLQDTFKCKPKITR